MAVKPFAFGARLRERGRSVRVRQTASRSYVVEDARDGRSTRRRDHASLEGALRDLARTWRGRLQ